MQLADEMRRAGAQKQKIATIHVNWPQAVIRVSYQKEIIETIGASEVTMEDANISEQCDI